jgi:SagB-type dehydrogenase family enzyme
MKCRSFSQSLTKCCVSVATVYALSFGASDSTLVALPGPQLDKGRPLMRVLADRRSTREFGPEKLSQQDLSNLLWAGFGINRKETGGRTAPSAMNTQEIDLYVSMAEGLFRYEAREHALRKILDKDIRALTGKQPFVKDAPVTVILVADRGRMKKGSEDNALLYAAADAGFISENMYLYCASEGLATVVRAYVDKPALAKAMMLGSQQEVIFAQTVGHPRK